MVGGVKRKPCWVVMARNWPLSPGLGVALSSLLKFQIQQQTQSKMIAFTK